MSFLEILTNLKGKALDVKDIEIIKHTYELQSQNNEQLKELLTITKEKCIGLQAECDMLKQRCADLEKEKQELSAKIPKGKSLIELSDLEKNCLKIYCKAEQEPGKYMNLHQRLLAMCDNNKTTYSDMIFKLKHKHILGNYDASLTEYGRSVAVAYKLHQ